MPVPFNALLPALALGRGDVAAAGLTITPERKDLAVFTKPYLPSVREIVVTHRDVTGLNSLEDLVGHMVHLRSGSSYVTNLKDLSERLAGEGLDPIKVIEADPSLTTEDILELVNAGIIDITVADHHVAGAWAQG